MNCAIKGQFCKEIIAKSPFYSHFPINSLMVKNLGTKPSWPFYILIHVIRKPKIVSMIRKYHNHKPQTTPWHRKEEPFNHHETPGRQIKQSNQPSLPHQDDCNTRMHIKLCTTKHRGGGGRELKCILQVPNIRPRFCCCWSTRNVQLPWRPSS